MQTDYTEDVQEPNVKPAEEPTKSISEQLSDLVAKVADKVNASENILVALSRDPNVDEMSAAIAISMILDQMGKHVTAIYSGETPNTLEFLKPDDTFEKNTNSLQDFIIAIDKNKADHLRYKIEGDYVKVYITPYRTVISEKDLEYERGDYNVDLVITFNVDSGETIDGALEEYGRIMHDATAVNITTSVPGHFAETEWADPAASSVCEMVMVLADKMGFKDYSAEIATALLTGIVAATERFSNNRTTPDTMSLASKLMGAGADQQLISSNIMKPAEEEKKEEPAKEEPSTDEPAKDDVKEDTPEEKPVEEPAESSANEPTEEKPVEDLKASEVIEPPKVEDNPLIPAPVLNVPEAPVMAEAPAAPVMPSAPEVVESPKVEEQPMIAPEPVAPAPEPAPEPEQVPVIPEVPTTPDNSVPEIQYVAPAPEVVEVPKPLEIPEPSMAPEPSEVPGPAPVPDTVDLKPVSDNPLPMPDLNSMPPTPQIDFSNPTMPPAPAQAAPIAPQFIAPDAAPEKAFVTNMDTPMISKSFADPQEEHTPNPIFISGASSTGLPPDPAAFQIPHPENLDQKDLQQ
ncbi:MAG: hypothetical protein Q4E47_02355 [Candidatus Saccharibacteria bacterium]|nr:hypothetical protein [Candidatus Saccharibacteria bacterium]